MLVSSSVLFMAIVYVATSASVFKLRRKFPEPKFQLKGGLLIPSLGAVFSIYLISQCTLEQVSIGSVLLIVGILIYVKFSPRKEMTDLKQVLLSWDSVLERMYKQEQRFLAHALLHIRRA